MLYRALDKSLATQLRGVEDLEGEIVRSNSFISLTVEVLNR